MHLGKLKTDPKPSGSLILPVAFWGQNIFGRCEPGEIHGIGRHKSATIPPGFQQGVSFMTMPRRGVGGSLKMRKNEYESLEQFTSQYIGEWGPSDGHWFGLDFVYDGREYRFHTGWMYKGTGILPDGRGVMFGLYRKKEVKTADNKEYELLGEFADMDEVLESTVIHGRPFKEVIMDDDTEIVGQD